MNPNPSPSAQTAAAQAFRASQNANANLSAAAAAAALRKHSASPTSVEDVQTKRTLQRQSSTSSAGIARGSAGSGTGAGTGGGSLRRGPNNGGLRRSNSSGSMATRTFREQRSNLNRPEIAPASSEIIPVPPVPSNYSGVHQRSASGGGPAPRAASSPDDTAASGRGREQTLQRSKSSTPSTPASRTNISSLPELERRNSRGSINFSYPMNARPNSPRHSPTINNSNAESLTKQRQPTSGRSPVDASESVQSRRPEESGVKSQLNSSGISSPEEAPKEGVGATIGTTTSEPKLDSEQSLHDSTQENVIKNQEEGQVKEVEILDDHSTEQPVLHGCLNSSINEDDAGVGETRTLSPLGARILEGVPFTVQEDREAEDSSFRGDSPSSQHGNIIIEPLHESTPKNQQNEKKVELPSVTPSDSVAAGYTMRSQEQLHQHRPAASPPPVRRANSLSPNRTTRFSDQVAITHLGDHLHQPPPRSLSPAKSALKSPSTETGSPNWAKPAAGHALSETSEGTSVASDDVLKHAATSRKKAPKVSFDDEAEIIGTAASPPTSSGSAMSGKLEGEVTMASRGSLHTNQSGDKDVPRLGETIDDIDDYKAPRPALPSFGSIRGRRAQIDDDPDYRNNVSGTSFRKSSPIAPTGKQALGEGVKSYNSSGMRNQSENDPVVFNHNNQVTEGMGFGSPFIKSPSSEGGARLANDSIPSAERDVGPSLYPTIVDTGLPDWAENSERTKTVPVISVQPATPGLNAEGEPAHGEPSTLGKSGRGQELRGNSTAQDVAYFPGNDVEDTTMTQNVNASNRDENGSEESGDSIYSDAIEDLSDLEGDGFGSINAIVESPVSSVNRSPASPRKVNAVGTAETGNLNTPFPVRPLQESVQEHTKEQGLHTPVAVDPSSQAYYSQYQPHFRDANPHQESDREWPIKGNLNTSYGGGNSVQNTGSQTLPTTSGKTQHTSTKSGQSVPRQNRFSENAFIAPSRITSGAFEGGHTDDSRGAGISSKLRNKPSNGSDSSSSFTRLRSRPQSTGPYTLRRTMRGDPEHNRPLSEMGNHNNITSTGHNTNTTTMRTTLRGTAVTNGLSSHNSKSKQFSFAKFRKSKQATNVFDNNNKNNRYPLNRRAKLKSRIEDSSDEDTPQPRKPFRSRFEDSSDDDNGVDDHLDVTILTPVRGIPRRPDAVDGDSTDLEDSSDEEANNKNNQTAATRRPRTRGSLKSSPLGNGNTQATAGSEITGKPTIQSELEDYSLPQVTSTKPKKRIFNRFSLSKRTRGGGNNDDARIRKSELDSAARRDTPLERSKVELQQSRVGGGDGSLGSTNNANNTLGPLRNGTTKTSSFSPKLQKRNGRLGSGSWSMRTRDPSGAGVVSSSSSPSSLFLGTKKKQKKEESFFDAPSIPEDILEEHGQQKQEQLNGDDKKPASFSSQMQTTSHNGYFKKSNSEEHLNEQQPPSENVSLTHGTGTGWISRLRRRHSRDTTIAAATGGSADRSSLISTLSNIDNDNDNSNNNKVAVGTAALGRSGDKERRFPFLKRAFGKKLEGK